MQMNRFGLHQSAKKVSIIRIVEIIFIVMIVIEILIAMLTVGSKVLCSQALLKLRDYEAAAADAALTLQLRAQDAKAGHLSYSLNSLKGGRGLYGGLNRGE